jgi:hypothetical protein
MARSAQIAATNAEARLVMKAEDRKLDLMMVTKRRLRSACDLHLGSLNTPLDDRKVRQSSFVAVIAQLT